VIYSVELRLRVVQVVEPGGITGHHAYGFFLGLMARASGAVSTRLHDQAGPKPFTLSPVAPADPTARRLALVEGARLRLRVTLLQEEAFAYLADAVWRLPADQGLPLGTARVACDGLITAPDQSPWARFTSFEELLESAGEERRLGLAFTSPTTFRSKGDRNVLFPEPSLVLGSLLSRWNAFAPEGLNLGQDVVSAVRLFSYRLNTRMLDFGSYHEQGFCGQATYGIGEGLSRDQVRALQALAGFAFYGGVGAKTTMGMGQARRCENARTVPHRARGYSEKRG